MTVRTLHTGAGVTIPDEEPILAIIGLFALSGLSRWSLTLSGTLAMVSKVSMTSMIAGESVTSANSNMEASEDVASWTLALRPQSFKE